MAQTWHPFGGTIPPLDPTTPPCRPTPHATGTPYPGRIELTRRRQIHKAIDDIVHDEGGHA
jgi:hypothetical protein